MTRRWIVVFAIAASLLLATAPAATATQGSAELVVGAEQTTASDFQSGTLTNMTVPGSGTGASVSLSGGGQVVDDFEDGDTTVTAANWSGWSKNGGSLSAQQSTVLDGSWSGSFSTSAGWAHTGATRSSSDTPSAVSLMLMVPSNPTSGDHVDVRLRSGGTGGTPVVHLQIADGNINVDGSTLMSFSAGTTYSITFKNIDYSAGTLSVEINGQTFSGLSFSTSASSINAITINDKTSGSGTTRDVYFDDVTWGVASASSGSYLSAPMSVDNASSAWLNLSTLSNASAATTWQHSTDGGSTWSNVSSSTHTTTGNYSTSLSGSGTWRVRVDISATGASPTASIHDDGILFTNQAPDVTVPSPTGMIHTETPNLSVQVNDATFGTAQGESVTLKWFVDGNQSGSTTLDSAGTASWEAPELSPGNHTWHVVAVDAYGTSTTLETQSIEIAHFAPSIVDGSVSPADGANLTRNTVEYSLNLTDRDFPIDGDNVTATLVVDGESVGSTSTTSNGSVSVEHTIPDGGEHTYHWKVTDRYGLSTTSETRSLSVPAALRIYNESSPSKLVDNVSVTLRFFFQGSDDLVIERNATGGVVNMTGLPANRPFVAVASADGFRPRRIYLSSLYQQQDIYLLPDSAEFVSPTFGLQDYTGRFPESETVLVIKRPLTGEWQRVQADFFGATGTVSAQLKFNTRHNLMLLNTRTGQTKELGSYTPLSSGRETITVMSSGDVNITSAPSTARVSPSLGTLAAENTTLSVQYGAPSWDGSVLVSSPNGSVTLASTTNVTEGSWSPTVNLSGYSGETVSVVVDGSEVETFSVATTYRNQYSLLSTLGRVGGQIPGKHRGDWTTLVAVAMSALAAGFSAARLPLGSEAVGLVAVATLSGFVLISWAPVSLLFASGTAWISFAALRRGI